MSREIVERLKKVGGGPYGCDRTNVGFWTVLTEIERKKLVEEIERLLADEREKVREMCCIAACRLCRKGYKLLKSSTLGWEHEVPAKLFGNIIFEHCTASTIRQLDLTKDLAASSREEGINEPLPTERR